MPHSFFCVIFKSKPHQQQANQFVAPFHYDVIQFLPNSPGYDLNAPPNGGLSVRDRVATTQLTQASGEGSIDINFGTACTFKYRTVYPDPLAIIKQTTDVYPYRGFIGYTANEPTLPINRPVVSPLTKTQQPV